ncbi:helix-turn-helix domain-containing protein [Chryseobacterium turcicum]|uniref:AraC family transcriptional regulator n=1 Tax=Chryseobacterium turcicum TaxID=2898076 RepID=A0A9Q3YVK8_9FLAO|nr:AraC family transcriptional regulator [Chryseobacterium turcicum]MCD1117536.1 AraC family transcriptional regulator [Chryseobacterium turcicum]
MLILKGHIAFVFFLFVNLFQSQEQQNSYKKLSSIFNKYVENDERAMVYVNLYIQKAKEESDLKRLIVGYEEAIYYSSLIERKLKYSDSTIITALKAEDKDQISRSYLGKGIIYYYNVRNFKKALAEYIRAYQYSKGSEDEYLKNKIIYHLGIVKCYLGYNSEAAGHFVETASYFETNMKSDGLHENTRLNYESGYFNSIYRLSKCYHNLKLYVKEDSLIKIGLDKIDGSDKLSTEFAYFQKGRGIQLIRQQRPDEALLHFKIAEDILMHKQDVASLATVNFYLGKLYWNAGKRKESLVHLNKVDAMFNKYKMITPEIRSSYEYLINDTKEHGNKDKRLYYTTQLLKADSIIITDFPPLSSKMKYEYDTERLMAEKNDLMKIKHLGTIAFASTTTVGVFFLSLVLHRFKRKKRILTDKYNLILAKMNQLGKNSLSAYDVKICNDGNTKYIDPHFSVEDQKESMDEDGNAKELYNTELVEKVLNKLKIFEQKELYLNKNLKLPDVAILVGTNRTTLSYILNEHMNIGYPEYIKGLRINYITKLILEDKKYLQYKIESLAEICGMASRQVFRVHFQEINGMTPKDFVKKRFAELDRL